MVQKRLFLDLVPRSETIPQLLPFKAAASNALRVALFEMSLFVMSAFRLVETLSAHHSLPRHRLNVICDASDGRRRRSYHTLFLPFKASREAFWDRQNMQMVVSHEGPCSRLVQSGIHLECTLCVIGNY